MKPLLKRLFIDSATPYLCLAVLEDTKVLDSIYQKGDNNHSETLMPHLEIMLKRQGLKPKDIDEIYVGIGPGSYTGVRIGVVVAKVLAYSLNIPVYKVSSLALLASHYSDEKIIPYIDARRGYAFLASYVQKEGKLSLIEGPVYDELDIWLNQSKGRFVVEGEPDYAKIIVSEIAVKVRDVHMLAPTYLRKTEAEANLNEG